MRTTYVEHSQRGPAGPTGPAGPPGTAAGVTEEFSGEVAPDGSDTLLSFTLAFEPADPSALLFFVNGALQSNGSDYSVGGVDNKRITWLAGTGTAEFALAGADVLVASYEKM